MYAGSFFAIPLIRWFLIQNKNSKIVKRNQTREQRARAIESPDLSLRRKVHICNTHYHSYSKSSLDSCKVSVIQMAAFKRARYGAEDVHWAGQDRVQY